LESGRAEKGVSRKVMNPRRPAMSLFELTIVILVMGLLAAVTAPRLADSLRSAKLESAARKLVSHVDYIRAVAVNEGRTTTLVCNNTDQSYACENVDFPDRFGVPINVSLGEEYDPTMMLDADFDSGTSLSFDLEGTPRVGASPLRDGRIVIRSGNESYTVVVAAGSGETSLHRNTEQDPVGSDQYPLGSGQDVGAPQ
jgi:type II secretory pathway pseudopilin PulG